MKVKILTPERNRVPIIILQKLFNKKKFEKTSNLPSLYYYFKSSNQNNFTFLLPY